MAIDIVMPRLSDSMEEGTILQWFVSEGDPVKEGQPLVEVETDKASVTYEAEHDGVVLSLGAAVGDSVAVGAVIAVVGERGEALAAPAASAGAGAAPASESVAGPGRVPAGPGGPPAGPGGPPASFSRSPAGPGGPPAGPGGSPAGPSRSPAGPGGPPAGPGRVKASPLARRLAAELGVDLAALVGSGPQGRVTRADVERSASTYAPAGGNGGATATESDETAAPAGQRALTPVPPAPAARAAVPTVGSAKGEATRVALSRVQQTIARRMAESRATVPDFELRCQVDMSRAVSLREELRELADPAPSYNDLLIRAAALALREFPRVNGAYRDGELEQHSRVNVGIAVAAQDALLVPTIFDADRRTVTEIAATARALAAKVRDGTITPAELSGSTFSISNLGMFGIDSFSAVINPPQAAILAVGALRPRPVVDDAGAVVARPTLELTLACDHRILYGADGARFLVRVRELLERPLALLA